MKKSVFKVCSSLLFLSIFLGVSAISVAGDTTSSGYLIKTKSGEKITAIFEHRFFSEDSEYDEYDDVNPCMIMIIDDKGNIWVYKYFYEDEKYESALLNITKKNLIATVDIKELKKYIKLANNINEFNTYKDIYYADIEGWASYTYSIYYYDNNGKNLLTSNVGYHEIHIGDENAKKINKWLDDIVSQLNSGKKGLLTSSIDYSKYNFYGNKLANLQNGGYFASQAGTLYYTEKVDKSLETGIYRHKTNGEIIKLCDDNAKQLNVCGNKIYYIKDTDIYSININGKNKKCIFKLSDFDVYVKSKSTLGNIMIVIDNKIYFNAENCNFKKISNSDKQKSEDDKLFNYFINLSLEEGKYKYNILARIDVKNEYPVFLNSFFNNRLRYITAFSDGFNLSLYRSTGSAFTKCHTFDNLEWKDDFFPVYLTTTQIDYYSAYNTFENVFYFLDNNGVLNYISYIECDDYDIEDLYVIKGKENDNINKLISTDIKCRIAKPYKNQILYIEKGEKSRLYSATLDENGIIKSKLLIDKNINNFFIGDSFIYYIDKETGELKKKSYKF